MEKFNPNESYPVIRIQDHLFLFIDWRIDHDSVPEDMYVYEIADGDCDGCIARIQNYVMVNFMGTIVGKNPIILDNGQYFPEYGTYEYEGWFCGEYVTLQEYLDEYDGILQSCDESEPWDGEIMLTKDHEYTCEYETDGETFLIDDFKNTLEEYLHFYGITIKDLIKMRIKAGENVRTREVEDAIINTCDDLGVWLHQDSSVFKPCENEA